MICHKENFAYEEQEDRSHYIKSFENKLSQQLCKKNIICVHLEHDMRWSGLVYVVAWEEWNLEVAQYEKNAIYALSKSIGWISLTHLIDARLLCSTVAELILHKIFFFKYFNSRPWHIDKTPRMYSQ